MRKLKLMPDGSRAILRYQVWGKKGREKDYHLAFDTNKKAENYIKTQKGKFKIVKKYL